MIHIDSLSGRCQFQITVIQINQGNMISDRRSMVEVVWLLFIEKKSSYFYLSNK